MLIKIASSPLKLHARAQVDMRSVFGERDAFSKPRFFQILFGSMCFATLLSACESSSLITPDASIVIAPDANIVAIVPDATIVMCPMQPSQPCPMRASIVCSPQQRSG